MRCPDCAKFVGLETLDPEVDLTVDYERDEEAKVHRFIIGGNVRICRACAECGNELKEANFDVDQTVEVPDDEMPKLSAEADLSGDCEVDETESEATEEGGGRYAKSFHGARVCFSVRCDQTEVCNGEWTDKIAASQMDELV